MDNILASWVLKPIFERKDGKKDTLLNLEDRQEKLKKMYVRLLTFVTKSTVLVLYKSLNV